MKPITFAPPPLDPAGTLLEPAWLHELLLCAQCGRDGLLYLKERLDCQRCGASHPVRNGIADLIPSNMRQMVAAQQEAWKVREKACGRYELSPQEMLDLPRDPRIRAQLAWLRSILRKRGSCRVLEIGAGRGWASGVLAEDGHQVIASDILDDTQIGLGCAARMRSLTGLPLGCVLTGAERLPFRCQSFDFVFCFETLRHVPDLQRVLQEASRVLHSGGFFLAFAEPFRGSLTTQQQRLQDCITYRLARSWQSGALPSTARKELQQIRQGLGETLHEVCRRVPFCVAHGEAAGLHTTVLPVDFVTSLPACLPLSSLASISKRRAWLDAFARAFGLESAQLNEHIHVALQRNVDVANELLAYWTLVGNMDGVLIAQKTEAGPKAFRAGQLQDRASARSLDSLLLACAPDGMVPIYGVYPAEGNGGDHYRWIQPQAGFLVAGGKSVSLTITCPPSRFRRKPIRIEVYLESEQAPLLVILAQPGKTVTLKLPIHSANSQKAALLIRLSANLAFMPSDYVHGQSGDMRLLALQIRSSRF